MSKFKNFKEHWLNFFKDPKRFKIDIEADEEIETIKVSSPNLMNSSTIELMIFIEDETYMSMFDIRFIHPEHLGFNGFQRENDFGFKEQNNKFNDEDIQFMESLINNYLEKGYSETIHSYNGSIFKSEITILKEGKPETFMWHDKEHMMSNKVQRFLNRSFIEKRDVVNGPWK